MAKQHKHEEHVNHERWVISFADMMTLLFALFVVLYALGQADLTKLKKLKESVQFAFHISGEGKTKEEGLFEKQKGGGEATLPAPLVTAQDGAMREFLMETLPHEFEMVTGKSLEVVQNDDTITMRAPLSAFFAAGRPAPIQRDVYNWLIKAAQGSMTFTSDIRIIIEATDVTLGTGRDGRPVTSLELCDRRLWTLRKAMLGIPEVRPEMVRIEFAQQKDSLPGSVRANADWEDRAQVTFAFSNRK
jgi:Membrane MotB of proton-channel complex MotA/MotB